MKYLDEYRDGNIARRIVSRARSARYTAVGANGDLRRTDTHANALRHRRDVACRY